MAVITLEAASLQFVKNERQRGVAMTGRKRSQQFTDAALLASGIVCKREAFGDQISGYWN